MGKHLLKDQIAYLSGLAQANTSYRKMIPLFLKKYERKIAASTISTALKRSDTKIETRGRLKLTSHYQDLQILNIVRDNPFLTWKAINQKLKLKIFISPSERLEGG